MPNQDQNGRGASDERSWRRDQSTRGRDDERGRWSREHDDDRHGGARDRGPSMRGSYEDDRDEGYHSVERYGQGQSGYLAGRYAEDRSLGVQGRNQTYGDDGAYGDEDRPIGMGHDERFAGRGGEGYWEDRPWRGVRRGDVERRARGWADRVEGYGRRDEGLGQRGGYGTGIRGYGGAEQREYHGSAGYDRAGDWASSGGQGAEGYGGSRGYEGFGAQGPGPGLTGGMAPHAGPGGRSGQWGQGHQGYDPAAGRYGHGYVRTERGPHRGKGPVGYQRSDERIREAVCEALTDDEFVDASGIEVTVKNGEVTLAGTVPERRMKRLAEECVEDLSGVRDVHNQLKVAVETSQDRRRA